MPQSPRTTPPKSAARTTRAATETNEQIAVEQEHLDSAVRRRDALIAELEERADDVSRQRARELAAVPDGLVFGRIDTEHDERWRIGRIGVRDEHGDPLTLDWRAPIARSFYTATGADPQGLRSRRHIRTDGARVTAVDDEPLSGDDVDLVGDAALMRALDARRTGQLGEIAATLQAEQDAVVRADPRGVLVVQGGPGTGKTAVALHRAAFLLFTHEQIARRGVLIIGPNARFLDYIGNVLPSLGETQVVQLSPDTLLPGVVAAYDDPSEAQRVKGAARWSDILRRAVDARRPAADRLEVGWSEATLVISSPHMQRVIDEIEQSGEPLTAQRDRYRRAIVEALTDAVVAESAGALRDVEAGLEDVLDKVDASLARDRTLAVRRADLTGVDVDGRLSSKDAALIAEALVDEPEVAAAMERIWPTVDPQTVLRELLSDDAALARCAPELAHDEGAVVLRDPAGDPDAWSTSDIALLDEIAALVGAPAALGPVDTSGTTFSARAAADRTWVYGHVIVDEAQELSPMQWRALARRCPTTSFTIVGDVNQTASAAGASSWDSALAGALGDRLHEIELTVCYRTPHEVMALTPPILDGAGSTVRPPRAARSNGITPRRIDVPAPDVAAAALAIAEELAATYDGGQVGVIVPDHASYAAIPTNAPVVQVSAAEAKGLEFDAVVVVDPHRIASGERGWNALYVAMTRCTQELVVIADRPEPLAGGSF